MKKNDIRLICAVFIIAAGFYVVNTAIIHQTGSYVTVTVDGEEYGTYALDDEQEIRIGEANVFVIRDGRAEMIAADCPDQLCVHQKAINRDKETIVCLPNKTVLEVTSPEAAPYDSIVQ